MPRQRSPHLHLLPKLEQSPKLGVDHPRASAVESFSEVPTDESGMWKEYENHLLAKGRASGTISHRITAIRQLARDIDPLKATTADLESILARKAATLAPETRKNLRAAYRSFYQWAVREHLIDYNPATDLEPIRIPVTVPRVADDGSLQLALLNADLPHTAMILLARFACLRLSELTCLHTNDRQADTLRIFGKGGKTRIVYINEELMHILLAVEREQGTGYYFPGRYGGHMHPQAVHKVMKRLTGWNPHALRHAGATAAYTVTKDLRSVQLMLGHASMATTQRYLHPDQAAMRKVAESTTFQSATVNPHDPDRIFHPDVVAA